MTPAPGDATRRGECDATRRGECDGRLLRSMALRTALIEERQRREIAVGLHDEVGHSLVLAQMTSETLRSRLTGADLRLLDSVQDHLRSALRATRELTFELGSPDLLRFGLETAIETLGERMLGPLGIRLEVRAAGTGRIPSEIETIVHRCVRELLVNAAKHSGARGVSVSVERSERTLRVEVRDDGHGRVECAPERCGFGLLSVRSQVESLGGRFTVEAGGGPGATFSLVVPVQPPVP